MNDVRRQLRSRPWLAAWVLAAALALRVLVPAGFMPTVADGRVTLTLCSGVAPAPMARMHGMTHHESGGDGARSPCAYADLALPSLGSADAAPLAAALAPVAAAAARPVFAIAPRAFARLRPPLRGPPLPV